MNEYNVNLIDIKNLKVTSLGREIGNLCYKKWYSLMSEIIFSDKSIFKINPKGSWNNSFEVIRDDTVLITFKMNLISSISIKTNFDQVEQDFNFKDTGIFNNKFVLNDKNGQELLAIQPDFKWRKLNCDYNISASDDFEKIAYKEVLVMLTIFCANYRITMMIVIISVIVTVIVTRI